MQAREGRFACASLRDVRKENLTYKVTVVS